MSVSLISNVVGRTPASLVPTIERYVFGNQRTQMNRVNGAVGINDATVVFEFTADGIRPGAYMEIDDEMFYVWSVSGQTATVERAQLGTESAAHLDNAVIRVEPRYTRQAMVDEIAAEIRSWSPAIYARYAGSLSFGAEDEAIDLDGLSGVVGAHLLRVNADPPGTYTRWPRLEARIERRQDLTAFPSGYSLVIPQALQRATEVRVVVRAPLNVGVLGASDDFGSLGMSNDMVDVIPWGVAAKLVALTDVARTDSNAQGRSRPAEEVRVGDASSVGSELLKQRDRLLTDVANRLLAEDGMGWA